MTPRWGEEHNDEKDMAQSILFPSASQLYETAHQRQGAGAPLVRPEGNRSSFGSAEEPEGSNIFSFAWGNFLQLDLFDL